MPLDIKKELIQYYQWLRQYGINDSHSGNASVRDGDTVWVTPTGACADTLKVEELIECKIGQAPAAGASLDAALHLAVYEKNPKFNAVLHSHCVHAVALTMNGKDFIPADFEGNYYFGKVPVINLPNEEIISAAPEAVSEALKTSKAAIVCKHGVYAAAESLNLAYKWTCSLELSAKTTFIAQMAKTI
jgi:L-fuculose-phosphate aldolase